MTITAGARVGPYELLAPLGAGGMGQVWTARDTRLDRRVAVKFATEHFSARFEREARAIAALNHPHICTLYDVGPDYLVMELIDGQPLAGPLPLDRVRTYASQILEALDAAHRKGITHRDLKPANILVSRQGIKLLDFGLAKQAEDVAAERRPAAETTTGALTGANTILGTVPYMSPEQIQGKPADARSDIFAFGLVLYELLTCTRAFDGASPASVMAAIVERPAPAVVSVAPAAVDRVVQKCLAKDPDERWQSARDLRTALEWSVDAAAPEPRAHPRVHHGGEGAGVEPPLARGWVEPTTSLDGRLRGCRVFLQARVSNRSSPSGRGRRDRGARLRSQVSGAARLRTGSGRRRAGTGLHWCWPVEPLDRQHRHFAVRGREYSLSVDVVSA